MRLLNMVLCVASLASTSVVAEELEYSFNEVLELGEHAFPIGVRVVLSDATETRLRADVVTDLQSFQTKLPEILKGDVYEDCDFGVSLDLDGIEPSEKQIVLLGEVELRLNSCRDDEGQTLRSTMLSAKVDVTAEAFGELIDQCIYLGVSSLSLDAKGLIGGLADLFGIVSKAEDAIVAAAQQFTKDNPICPDLPDALEAMNPTFDQGGLRELPNGTIGAYAQGTVEITATNTLSLLRAIEADGMMDSKDEDCGC